MWISSAFSSSFSILNQFSYFKVIWGWLWCYRRERTSMSKNWLQKEISTPVTLSPHTLTFRWVAVNTVDFFNQINMLYGTITEFCTEQSCTVMSAGPKYEVRIQQLSEDEQNMKYGILIFNALLNFSVSLGRRESSEETNQMFGAQVHRLPYDMGSG